MLFKRKFNSRVAPFFILIFTVAIIVPVVVLGDDGDHFNPSPGSSKQGACVTGGKYGSITCSSSTAVTIFNNSSVTYFIPNKTANEWNSFLAHTPSGIFVSYCGDNACTYGETSASCPADCPATFNAPYCGDGICQNNSRMWNLGSLTTANETCSNCAADCGICATAACGVCGLSGSGGGCNNTCTSLGGTCTKVSPSLPLLYTGWPSSYQQMVNEWRYLHGCDNYTSNTDPQCNADEIKDFPELVASSLYQKPSFEGSLGWVCSYSSGSNLCPAGYYCPADGKGTNTHYPCPAGSYCPAGSGEPSFCPSGTYSASGASVCTPCPCEAGTVGGIAACDGIYSPGSGVLYFGFTSALNSTSFFSCYNRQYCGDGYCDAASGEARYNCSDCQ